MIAARVEIGALNRVLIAMRKPDLRRAWREARLPLRNDIKDHRQKRTGPSGSWAPRAASTKERDRTRGRSRRALLGKLPTALQTLSDNRSVAMKSRVAWSDVHQKGGTAGHGAKEPKREFLYASNLAMQAIGYILTRHLEILWGRAS